METTLRIVLAAVLLWAAAAKLRDLRGPVAAMGAHGIPAAARAPAAAALAATEAGLAVLLLIGPAARLAAGGVALLGLAFAGSLLRLRLRGARWAPCGCFGASRERPVVLLVARALALAAAGGLLAAGVADRPWPSSGALVAGALALLTAAVAALTVLVLALYRQMGVLEGRLGPRSALELAEEGPELGRPAPALAGLSREGPELVAFASPGCRLCAEIAPALAALARAGLVVHAVNEDEDPGAFGRFRVPGTPFVAYLVDGAVVAKGLVNTLEQIEELISTGEGRLSAAVSGA